MAGTCFTCGTGYSGSCCSSCQPANVIYQGECTDPGTLTIGRHLVALDYKFCEGRIPSGAGFLVSNINGSGNAGFSWTTTPQVQLQDYQAVANTTFGQLVVMGSDYRWRALAGPASLGLFLQTDANGNVIFGAPPAATVPDPLAINDLNVANDTTLNNLTTGGTVTLNNIAAGTVTNLLALNAANEVILQAVSAGVAASMFYEAATSPSATQPNSAKANGEYLVIGNRLFDSGANLISVTTSEAITVNVAGKYVIAWVALCKMAINTKAAVSLEINGVMVNNAGRTDAAITQNTGGTSVAPFTGLEVRSLSANDVLKLQLNSSGAVNTYNARLIAVKFAD